MEKVLDKILLSNNVSEQFYKNYENPEFKNWLLSILPEVEACKNQKQDNPWHIYNCLDHILHSIENINEQTRELNPKVRRILSYTMFFHDIGKPQCHIRRYSKFYGREVDSFFNHNEASTEIANRVLDRFDFSKSEQEVIKLLVHEHDIFMFLTLKNEHDKYHKPLTKELVDDYIKEYSKVGDGEKILKYLIMVGRADSLAQNPKMTKDSLHLLDIMENMVAGEYQQSM